MSFLPNLRRMTVIYRGYWGKIAISQIFALLMAACMIFIPMQVSSIINDASNIHAAVENAVLIALFAVLCGVFCMANVVYSVRIAEATGNYVRNGIYKKIQSYSFGNLDRFSTGELLTRLTSDIYQINIGVQLMLRAILMAPFAILVSVILVGLFSPELLWIMAIVIILSFVVFGYAMMKMQKQFKARQENYDIVNTTLQENMAGIRVVKAFVRQKFENDKFFQVNEKFKEANIAPLHTNSFTLPSALFIMGIATFLLILAGGPAVIAGTMKVGAILAFFQYVFIIVAQMWQLSLLIPQIVSAEASAGRLKEIWDTVPEIVDTEQKRGVDLTTVKGGVIFENVSFAYDKSGDTDTLKGINLEVAPGETVAFLGANGSGKSTLVSLIPRFYDPTSGRILIDGIDVKEIPQDNLRQIVGIALQKAFLFSGNIIDNISFGNPDIPYEGAVAAAKVADADGFVSNLPEKYDAPVSRKGQNFSGGQQQRLSMARAFTVKPHILILDDSTSAVDVETEGKILGALPQFLSGVTRLIISSRVSTALAADKIVVLDKGEITAVGTHKELISSSPLYKEIFASQLGGLRKEDVS
ncbi:MAG: ABC transporter ATP-binding protein [Methanospirillaceae archaeon]|nr:ABC transporter ATP-binding protein [Methanospirillaceae archaeon]